MPSFHHSAPVTMSQSQTVSLVARASRRKRSSLSRSASAARRICDILKCAVDALNGAVGVAFRFAAASHPDAAALRRGHCSSASKGVPSRMQASNAALMISIDSGG